MLKILHVNCQSIRATKQHFAVLTQQHNPDIIVGTESWLTESIKNSEVFPTDQYSILRRDRPNDPHGGVLIATKHDLLVTREEELETKCEILWCRIEMAGSKTLHIAAYYRPQEGDESSLMELERSLSRLDRKHLVILGGDFNLPGWNWESLHVEACNYPTLHHFFGDIINDHGLSQLVNEPSRRANVLDLMLINNPTLIHSTKVVPGISDHDCPIVEVDVRPPRKQQARRKVPVYSKADWDSFEVHMQHVASDITSKSATASFSE